jgi:tetratricopeptide (TPR) repeat protein
LTGIERIRSVLFAILVPAVLASCDNVGPPPPGAKVVRVRPQSQDSETSSASAPVGQSSSPPSSRVAPLPDEVQALSSIPGCKCSPGYQPVAAAEPFYQASLSATREGRFGDALDSASRAVSVGLGLDVYKNQLAIALFNAGRAEEALAKWQEIAQGSPDGCELGFYAAALQGLGRPAEAESIARRFVRQCSASSTAHYLLASALYDLGRLDAAGQEATEAINLDSEDPQGYHLRSIIREKRNLLDGALSDARAAAMLKPDDAGYRYREASVLWEMERYSEARQPISAAARLSPKDAAIQYLRSMILERADELNEALQAAKDAVGLDGNNASYLRQLGDVYEALERPAEAIQAFDRSLALELAPGVLYSRAMCHNKIGQREAALRDLERKSPGFQNTRDWIESLEGQ